ncbi:MAG: hypothetical protein UR26_C0001G0135 [candidate division TM6 bacterium GW2011_GWF2_32_72]|nr:MAG: hypothetical protein UR26_C0001G0135 [candidate division TM6 bacterium GW2011_GWF2_32_72]
MLTTSVIVATRNRLKDIVTMLDSLVLQTLLPNEVIIIDSSDTWLMHYEEFTQRFNKNFFTSSKLIYKHTPRGAAYQRNVGINLASSELLLFFDDDVELLPDYIEQVVKTLEKHPQYFGGQGDAINHPVSSKLSGLIRKFFMLHQDQSHGAFLFSGMSTHAYGTKNFKQIECVGGCCMFFKAAALKDERFDESLRDYSFMEDCDLSKRVSNKFPLCYIPTARLYHYHSPAGRDRLVDLKKIEIRNYSYLFFKNFYPQNRLRILGYTWTLFGMFCEAAFKRETDYFVGYWRGLKEFYWG